MLPQAVADANASECTADDENNETDEGNQVIEAEATKSAAREACSTDKAKSNDDYTQRGTFLRLAILFDNSKMKDI
jgi:hypothetical protein